MGEYDYDVRHRKIALPCVRIRAKGASGSGTIIHSKEGSTYILTNHHVVKKSITIENKWSSLLKSEKKTDIFEVVEVHLFDYQWESRAIGGMTIQADIMAYDKEEDLALLRLRNKQAFPDRVAELYPREKENELRVGMKVIAIGAGMGEPPIQTEGLLSQFGQEIDRREYWLNSASTIFGNSGGSLFLKESLQLIGVPARISIAMVGFSIDPIPHLSYSVPITRIYNFLEEQKFRFIYDDTFTEEEEEELRKTLREDEERKIALSIS